MRFCFIILSNNCFLRHLRVICWFLPRNLFECNQWYTHILTRFHDLLCKSEICLVVSDSLWPHGLDSPWNSPGQNTGVGSLSLLQGIFPTQGLNPVVLNLWFWILLGSSISFLLLDNFSVVFLYLQNFSHPFSLLSSHQVFPHICISIQIQKTNTKKLNETKM